MLLRVSDQHVLVLHKPSPPAQYLLNQLFVSARVRLRPESALLSEFLLRALGNFRFPLLAAGVQAERLWLGRLPRQVRGDLQEKRPPLSLLLLSLQTL